MEQDELEPDIHWTCYFLNHHFITALILICWEILKFLFFFLDFLIGFLRFMNLKNQMMNQLWTLWIHLLLLSWRNLMTLSSPMGWVMSTGTNLFWNSIFYEVLNLRSFDINDVDFSITALFWKRIALSMKGVQGISSTFFTCSS